MRVLVANRGEIVRRVFRTARRLGFECVAVYSEADATAPFVREADAAVCIGPPPASDSYLRVDRIVEAALETGTKIVHPGYGFLAEDPALARACAKAGLMFAGPTPEVLELMGDKARAKQVAKAAGVPTLPGYEGEEQSDEALTAAAAETGYPLVVKPALGGGGKGMAVVRSAEELQPALDAARRIGAAAFGDAAILLERYLERPRHVEVQILADAHGNAISLGERDCSVQRRHQKVVEEAPAPGLDDTIRTTLHESAVALARHTGYTGAGTCEFLVGEDGTAGFIEMNARLQVEHPVTELVYGVDLVEHQLRIAMGEPLSLSQQALNPNGHAVEVRVYAEDPAEGFLPQAGRVLHVRWGPGVRVDSGIEEGTDVPPHYDPMLAKVVAHGPSRAEAYAELTRALAETEILGPRTNLPFLKEIVDHPDVRTGAVPTTWLSEALSAWRPPEPGRAEALALAAAFDADRILRDRTGDPWSALGPWRAGAAGRVTVVLVDGDDEHAVEVAGAGPFESAGFVVRRGDGCHEWWLDDRRAAVAEGDSGRIQVWLDGAPLQLVRGPAERRPHAHGAEHLGAPMPGQVVAVRVAQGDEVQKGDELVVVEAMKMEHSIRAPEAGVVTAVRCRPGDQVDRGQTLVDVEVA